MSSCHGGDRNRHRERQMGEDREYLSLRRAVVQHKPRRAGRVRAEYLCGRATYRYYDQSERYSGTKQTVLEIFWKLLDLTVESWSNMSWTFFVLIVV